jgi:hypothetical protein
MAILTCGADRLIETALADFHASGEESAGEHADFVPLLDDRVCGSIRCAASYGACTCKYSRLRHCTPAMNLDLLILVVTAASPA